MSLTQASGAEGEGSSVKRGSTWISAKTSERCKLSAFALLHSYIHRFDQLYSSFGPIAVAQNAYASDPKYKKYVQQVEKCLNSFDNVHEWADCIAFLKQLLKVRDPRDAPSSRLPYSNRLYNRTHSSKRYRTSSLWPNGCRSA